MDDAISQLAAASRTTRPLMTAGFVAFGLAVPAYGVALRRAGLAWAGAAAVVTGLATLGAAAFPVGGRTGAVHGVFAMIGYVALAAVPALAAPRLGPWAALASRAVAVAVVVLLVASAVVDGASGLFQRLGLTVGDVWLMASAASQRPRR